MRCSNCGSSNPAGASFCMNCGSPLKMNENFPESLKKKLESAREKGSMKGERRIVTMVFCDVKDSTKAAGQLDPEEWAEVINGTFEHMIQPIYRYEGTIARLLGDGLLAFFGAPIVHEDDPQRAVLASLEIIDRFPDFRNEVRLKWGVDIDVRIGINTGLVVVGDIGNDLHMEYTAIGDAINMAARMEQTAEAGTVQLTPETYRLVSSMFEFDQVENLEIKGKEGLQTAYRVKKLKPEPGNLRGLTGLVAPLIGRTTEVNALEESIDALQFGSGAIISVIGEAGIGKSRLVAECLRSVDRKTCIILEGHSYSYEIKTPYSPFADMLIDYFKLSPYRSEDQWFWDMESLWKEQFPDDDTVKITFLASLMDLPIPAEYQSLIRYLEPNMLRQMIFTHVRRFFLKVLRENALIVYFDDIHWMDHTSLELLESLLPIVKSDPILFILASRPNQQKPSWRILDHVRTAYGSQYKQLNLQPLEEYEVNRLVSTLLSVENMPKKVRDLILAKSDGNPFYVEEIIRSLIDACVIVNGNGTWRVIKEIDNLDVPSTLNGVIISRLDQLDHDARGVVQAGSVIGRIFSYDILKMIFGQEASLEDGLSQLMSREIIKEKTREPERIFSFKHVLTQEAAYQSILLSQRRFLHQKTAETLKTHQPTRYGEIAQHFMNAQMWGEAFPFLVNAGDQASKAFATEEAIHYYRLALGLKISSPNRSIQRRAYEGLGSMLTQTNQNEEAFKIYSEMITLAQSVSDIDMEVSGLNKTGSLLALNMSRFNEGETYLNRAEKLSRASRNTHGIAEGTITRCMMCTAKADFEGVSYYMGDLIQISQETGDKEFISLALEHIAYSLTLMVKFEEAESKAFDALKASREAGELNHESVLLAEVLPIIELHRGNFNQALSYLEEGVAIAERIENSQSVLLGCWLAGDIYRMRGEYSQAIQFGKRSLDIALPLENYVPYLVVLPLGLLGSIYLEINLKYHDEIHLYHDHALRLLENPVGMMAGGSAWADLGWCALMNDDLEIAETFFQKGLHSPSMFMHLEKARHLSGMAKFCFNKKELDQAEVYAKEASEYVIQYGILSQVPLTALVKGMVNVARGDRYAALYEYDRAGEIASKMEMRPTIIQVMLEKARLFINDGKQKEAKEILNEAAVIIDEISTQLSDRELRESYLEEKYSLVNTLSYQAA
jgi:class 3 adenylate cyclase/tetratricopeptide (TPR) repeat protein